MTATTHESSPVPTSLCEELYFRLLQMWGPSVYGRNMYMAHLGEGAFVVRAAEEALNDVVARQESLRASYDASAGPLVKSVLPTARVTIEVRDLGAIEDERLHDEVARCVEAPIPLQQAPLLRAVLLRRSENAWAFVIVVHHLAFDAGSFPIFFADFSAAYRARLDNTPPQLVPPQSSGSDFARWQHEYFTPEKRASLAEFWSKRVRNYQPIDESLLKGLGVAPGSKPGGRMVVPFSFDAADSAAIRSGCTKSGSSLVMFTCVGFGALLKRHTQRTDITFMYLHNLRSQFAMHNRAKKASVEGTLGYFANGLPYHVDIEDGLTGRELVRRGRQEMIDISGASDIPLPCIDESYARSIPRLFTAGFNFQRQRVVMEMPGATLTRMPREDVESTRWHFHQLLECRLIETSSLSGYMIADSGFLTRPMVDRLIADYRTTLRTLATDPEARL